MMNRMNRVYNAILPEDAFIRSAINAAENTEVKRHIRPAPIVAAACAVVVIGASAVFLFPKSDIPDESTGQVEISYAKAAEFKAGAPGNSDSGLICYDGFGMWIEGAYYNGSRIVLAICGECLGDRDDRPDTAIASLENAEITVNGQSVQVVSEELKLTGNKQYYEGTLELMTEIDDSVVRVELHIPDVTLYRNGELQKSIQWDFAMTGVVTRIYTDDEESFLRGGDMMYLGGVSAVSHGIIGDADVGLIVTYYVPDEVYFKEGRDVRAAAINADGTTIPYIRETHHTNASGEINTADFEAPDSRDVCIVLYDAADGGKVLTYYQVHLNDPDMDFSEDD